MNKRGERIPSFILHLTLHYTGGVNRGSELGRAKERTIFNTSNGKKYRHV